MVCVVPAGTPEDGTAGTVVVVLAVVEPGGRVGTEDRLMLVKVGSPMEALRVPLDVVVENMGGSAMLTEDVPVVLVVWPLVNVGPTCPPSELDEDADDVPDTETETDVDVDVDANVKEDEEHGQ